MIYGAIIFAKNKESDINNGPPQLAGLSLHVGFVLCVAAAVIGIVAGIILFMGSLISCCMKNEKLYEKASSVQWN